MKDYLDDHSPDIALLLTVARAVRALLGPTTIDPKPLDEALKPFEHYPDPTETEETGL